MRILICLTVLGAVASNNIYPYNQAGHIEEEESFGQKYQIRQARFKDGAQYDEEGNRISPRTSSYTRPEESYEQPQFRIRRQNQGGRFQKANRPLRPVSGPRPLRPVERREPEADRREYIFRPNQQRPLRPAGPALEKFAEPDFVPTYNEIERADSRPTYDGPLRDVADERRYVEKPKQKKVFERNAETTDQLKGESFQPTYTAYAAPKTAYDNAYVPPEQKSIQEAVAKGAANYNGDTYEDPKRLSFQIHGQDGPNSYRFGYDTGIGYNRQFRYEERDNYGVLHGRYGYYDQEGKLQVVNYTADPETGYHADGEHVPKPQY